MYTGEIPPMTSQECESILWETGTDTAHSLQALYSHAQSASPHSFFEDLSPITANPRPKSAPTYPAPLSALW
jgi:hypothetical protein